MKRSRPFSAQGFILVAVMLALIVVGAIAYLLNREGAMNVEMAYRDEEAVKGRYIAEAGLAYAQAKLNATESCQIPAADANGYIFTGSMDKNGNLGCTGSNCDSFGVEVVSTQTSPLRLELKSSAKLANAAGTQASAVTALSKTVIVYTGLTGTVDMVDPTKVYDTYLTNSAQTTNYGSLGKLIVDNGGKAGPILINFNLTPNASVNFPIPVHTKLLSAHLRMTFNSATNSAGLTPPKAQQFSDITAHKITTPWNETEATYNKANATTNWISATNFSKSFIPYLGPAGFNYSGVAITNNASTAVTIPPITNGGGDYDPAYIASMENRTSPAIGVLPTPSNPEVFAPSLLDSYLFADGQIVRWNITPLVAEWIAGADNYGIDSGVALKAEESLGLAAFYSSEDGNQARRPTLSMTYKIPCGGPTVDLAFRDAVSNAVISETTTAKTVKLEITLRNTSASPANLTAGLTIPLNPVTNTLFSPTANTQTGFTVSGPTVTKTLTGCGSMIFNPAVAANSLTLSGGSIPATSGNTPGTCTVTVLISSSQISGKVPGTYPNAAYPNGAPTTLFVASGALQTSSGNNSLGANAGIFVNPSIIADTYISNFDGAAAASNYGLATTLRIHNNKPKNTLIKFSNLGIPTGSSVKSAKLRLYVSAINTPSVPRVNLIFAVNPLIADWVEGTGTDAAPQSSVNATWKQKITGTNWGTNGGDFSATPIVNYTFASTATAGSWIEIPVTTIVQPWVSNLTVNYGFIIRVTTGTNGGFDEIVLGSNQSPNFAPQLIVTYQ